MANKRKTAIYVCSYASVKGSLVGDTPDSKEVWQASENKYWPLFAVIGGVAVIAATGARAADCEAALTPDTFAQPASRSVDGVPRELG